MQVGQARYGAAGALVLAAILWLVQPTTIPDDFPLAAGMSGPADSVPTSRTGTGLRDLDLDAALAEHGLALANLASLPHITVAGAIYLALVSLIPLIALVLVGANQNFPFGGASILIIVGVGLETVKQIDAQLQQRHYEGLLR